ncbi:MAG: AI-2E family transporter [Oscillospiraceae bacterium]|nr:AI-2E family transporter [Oscillospiraceae bacterium]
MRFFDNKRYNKIFGYCFAFITVVLLVVLFLFQWDTVSSFFGNILNVLEPVIWGLVIAFIMNSMVKRTEIILGKTIFHKKPHPKTSRAIGIAVASIIIIAVITLVIMAVIPQIITSIPGIYDGLVNEVYPAVETWLTKLLDDYPSIASAVNSELENLTTYLSSLLSNLASQLSTMLTSLLSFANSVLNFIIGFFVAIYFMASKELLQMQAKKLIVALFPERIYHPIFTFTSSTNHALLGFIYGKILDSIIMGCLCAVGMLILQMPYGMIISIIVGITNIIPIFGPFIGAIPSAILVLIAEPRKVIWFVIFILVLQQIDGNIIGPKILGNRIGISSFWVLISIIVCGNLFGIVGMIIGVPLFAVVFDILSAIVKRNLTRKNMPTETSYYSMAGVKIGSDSTIIPAVEASENKVTESEAVGDEKDASGEE